MSDSRLLRSAALRAGLRRKEGSFFLVYPPFSASHSHPNTQTKPSVLGTPVARLQRPPHHAKIVRGWGPRGGLNNVAPVGASSSWMQSRALFALQSSPGKMFLRELPDAACGAIHSRGPSTPTRSPSQAQGRSWSVRMTEVKDVDGLYAANSRRSSIPKGESGADQI